MIRVFKLENMGKKLLIVLVLAIFFTLNFLFSFVSSRLDLSQGAAYTLSKSSKKVLHDLKRKVIVNFFVTSDLPARLLPLKTDVADLLGEYKKAGGGKIEIRTLDPKKDEKTGKLAADFAIPELQFSQLEKDKYAVTAAYFGIGLLYEDKRESIPQVTDIESLEYNLTSSIYKMTKKELPKIGIVSAKDDLSSLKKILSQQFQVKDTTLDAKGIDQTFKTLMVIGEQTEYSADEIKLLKNYLNKGGKIILLSDGVEIADDLTVSPAKTNLNLLLADYGININKNLVLSTSAELVNFGTDLVSFFSPYPFWIKTNSFNPKVSYFSNVNQLTFPWVSALSMTKKKDIATMELVKTNDTSWEQKELSGFFLNPQQIPQPKQNEVKQFSLVAEAKQGNSQVIVIPSSRFVSDNFLSRTSNNLDFVLNLLNETASGGALSGIRQRAVSFYPLPELNDNQKDIFKYLNILLLPGLFALFGLYKLLKDKSN